jgi:hypothetical protein
MVPVKGASRQSTIERVATRSRKHAPSVAVRSDALLPWLGWAGGNTRQLTAARALGKIDARKFK